MRPNRAVGSTEYEVWGFPPNPYSLLPTATTVPNGFYNASRSFPSRTSACSTLARFSGWLSQRLTPDGWGNGTMLIPSRSNTWPMMPASGLPFNSGRNCSMAIRPMGMTSLGRIRASSLSRQGRHSSRSAAVGTNRAGQQESQDTCRRGYVGDRITDRAMLLACPTDCAHADR